jgi:hypothetical protein
MTHSAFFTALHERLAGLQIGSTPCFQRVATWDSDAPDAQLKELQESDGRFALVVHDGTDYRVEQRGLVQTMQTVIEVGVLISNRQWKSKAPPDAPEILDVMDALSAFLRGRPFPEVTLEPQKTERFRPQSKAGTAEGRIIYRFGFHAVFRSREPMALTR